jgi:hypothetical protein
MTPPATSATNGPDPLPTEAAADLHARLTFDHDVDLCVIGAGLADHPADPAAGPDQFERIEQPPALVAAGMLARYRERAAERSRLREERLEVANRSVRRRPVAENTAHPGEQRAEPGPH